MKNTKSTAPTTIRRKPTPPALPPAPPVPAPWQVRYLHALSCHGLHGEAAAAAGVDLAQVLRESIAHLEFYRLQRRSVASALTRTLTLDESAG